jgi:hypothetical protein
MGRALAEIRTKKRSIQSGFRPNFSQLSKKIDGLERPSYSCLRGLTFNAQPEALANSNSTLSATECSRLGREAVRPGAGPAVVEPGFHFHAVCSVRQVENTRR